MKRSLSMLLIAATLAAPAWAANESREKQMLRRVQQQMQQIEQARAQAEQEKAAALADRDALERERDRLRGEARRLSGERTARIRAERALKGAQDEIEALRTTLADAEARLAESQRQAQTTARTLADAESARRQTEATLAGARQDLGRCADHNGRLYGLGRELMAKYRDKTCQDALAQAEPFTGLRRVEVENLLEAWRDRADAERLAARPDGGAPADTIQR